MIAVTGVLCALLWFDAFSRLSGFLLLALLIAYLAWSLMADCSPDRMLAESGVNIIGGENLTEAAQKVVAAAGI